VEPDPAPSDHRAEDVPYVERAIPDAQAIALQSGWPTPRPTSRGATARSATRSCSASTAPYQIVQDYRLAAGDPLTDLDVRERRLVAVLGFDVAEKLFDDAAGPWTSGCASGLGRFTIKA